MNDKENEQKNENKTGRYVYDKNLKKIVKISDEIVGINKSSSSDTSTPSCGCGEGCSSCDLTD